MARHRKSSRGSITRRIREGRPTRYEVRITVGYTADGKQIQTSKSFPTYKEADRYKTEQLAKFDRNEFRLPSKITLGEWLDKWLDEFVRSSVKPSTFSAYKGVIENHINPRLGGIQLNKLDAMKIQRFYNELVRPPKSLGEKTLKNVHLVLNKGLKKAVALHWLDFNPTSECELPKSVKVKKETHPLTAEQVGKLLAAAEEHPHQPLYILAIYTGMRVSELLGLQWSDVDFDSKTITVRQQLQWLREEKRYELISTKNAKVRSVPMVAEVVEALKEQRRRRDEWRKAAGELWCESDFVFTKENGEHLTQPSVYHRLKRAMIAIGRPDAYFHTLRHTFGTLAESYGASIEAVSKILGHHSSQFTEKTYVHTPTRYLRESIEAFGNGLSSAINDAANEGTVKGTVPPAQKEKASYRLRHKAFNKRNVAEVERFENYFFVVPPTLSSKLTTNKQLDLFCDFQLIV